MGPSALAISPRPYGILTNSNWGVVQLVGHLTVNAHEAILQGQARERTTEQMASIYARSRSFAWRKAAHVNARNRNPN